MLLDNGKKIFRIIGTGSAQSQVITAMDGTTSGGTWTADVARAAIANPYYAGVNNRSCFLVLGDSDAPEEASQYSLQGNRIEGNLTKVSHSIVASDVINMTVTYRNDTASSITVKEIGYVIWQGYNSADYSCTMLSRKVYDTPVTIPPGESRTFTVLITINPQ